MIFLSSYQVYVEGYKDHLDALYYFILLTEEAPPTESVRSKAAAAAAAAIMGLNGNVSPTLYHASPDPATADKFC